MVNVEGKRVVWIAGESWDRDGGGQREMAIALTAYAHILWVDPPLSPVTAARNRHGAVRTVKPSLTKVTDRIARLTPVALPGLSRPGVRATTPGLVRAQVRWALGELDLRPDVVVMLYLGGLLGGWGEDVANIMYGTDDYVAGAELMRVSAAYLRKRERQALSKADMVVALSTELAAKWEDVAGKPAVVVPNGCWPPSSPMNRPLAKKIDLPRPVAGFVGRLSDRTDFDILDAIADAGQSLLLVGPHDPRWEAARFDKLINKPSVRYIGPVPSVDVPAWMAAVDVGITPYRHTAFNRASFPLKTLEYLSVGVPAVSASLPAMRWLRADLEEVVPPDLADQILVLADDGHAYVNAIRAVALGASDTAAHCIEFTERHSWTRRAEQFATEAGLLTTKEKVP
jgi:teichuronic acid biosynthesis glycosyltransferase TuaH